MTTFTSDRPLTIDGVRLDTLAWNITKINRTVASHRASDVSVPGIDGVLPSYNDPLDAAQFGLEMFVMGTDSDGLVTGIGKRDQLRANLDELLHLFGKRHALILVDQLVDATNHRQAWAKVTDVIAPDVNLPGSSGVFTVGLTLVYGVWEDTATQDWSGTLGAASGTVQEVTTLQGATERSLDTIFLVTGPANNPRITDQATGAYVQLNQSLSAAQLWRVNMATWASRYGSGLTLGSADTTGTDGSATMVFGGTKNQAAYLPLVPIRDTGLRRVKVALSGSGGFTAATRLTARTRRKFQT
jgi:hypothetical protein